MGLLTTIRVSYQARGVQLQVQLPGALLWLISFSLLLGTSKLLTGAWHAGWMAAAFALYVLGVVVHEAGHVVVGRVAGVRLAGIIVKAGAAVQLVPELRSARSQLAVYAAGPLAQFAYGTVLLVVSCGLSMVHFTAALVMLEAVLNLAPVPFIPNLDGRKTFQCLVAIVRGQGHLPT